MDLEKLAQLLNDDVTERQAEVVETAPAKKEAAAEAATAPKEENDDEVTMKVASELFAMGDIIASGFVNHLQNVVKQAKGPDAGSGAGGAGSIAKAKGDALPNNTASVPADEAAHKLKEQGLKNTGPKVSTKGDSQGSGMGSGGGKSAADKAVLDRLSKALRK
jgi:hypothetical protein